MTLPGPLPAWPSAAEPVEWTPQHGGRERERSPLRKSTDRAPATQAAGREARPQQGGGPRIAAGPARRGGYQQGGSNDSPRYNNNYYHHDQQRPGRGGPGRGGSHFSGGGRPRSPPPPPDGPGPMLAADDDGPMAVGMMGPMNGLSPDFEAGFRQGVLFATQQARLQQMQLAQVQAQMGLGSLAGLGPAFGAMQVPARSGLQAGMNPISSLPGRVVGCDMPCLSSN